MSIASYPLELEPSLRAEAEQVAEREGMTLGQLVNAALAEKLSAMRGEALFRARAARADPARARAILARIGDDTPPREGDEC